jgi:hypothetical protein
MPAMRICWLNWLRGGGQTVSAGRVGAPVVRVPRASGGPSAGAGRGAAAARKYRAGSQACLLATRV